jgi:hypothetical protein
MKCPRAVRRLWEWWKPIAMKIGDFQARMILSFFYFVVLAPFALAVRWASDPLAIKGRNPPVWGEMKMEGGADLEQASRQF